MSFFPFFKMHGLSNDFIIFDTRQKSFKIEPQIIKKISNRRIGIGCDQIVFIERSNDNISDAKVLIFNCDGKEAESCGNALRCIGRLLFRGSKKNDLTIETKGGLVDIEKEKNGLITVDMGLVKFNWDDIPLSHPLDSSNLGINFDFLKDGFAVNIGNPHVVFFSNNTEKKKIIKDCKRVSSLKIFPEGVNVSVAKVLSRSEIELIVYERGVGFTPSCGTGACATSVVASRLNFCNKQNRVIMEGGELNVEFLGDNHVLMTGPASDVFEGKLNLENFE